MRSIGHIRKYRSLDGLKMLVNALVISRLDYCYCLLSGVPKYQRDKLQRIQNTAARLVMGPKTFRSYNAYTKELALASS